MATTLRELLTNDEDWYIVRGDEDPGDYLIKSEMLESLLSEEELNEPAEWDARNWKIRLVREIGVKPAKYERMSDTEIERMNESGEFDPWKLVWVVRGEA